MNINDDIKKIIKDNNLYTIETIEKIYKLIDLTNRIDQKLFYRGHGDSNWTLSSSFSRKQNSETINTFVQQNKEIWEYKMSYLEKCGYKLTKLEALAQLQHKNSDTILIDFTSELSHALWFATNDQKENDIAIYILDYKGEISNKIKDFSEINKLYKCPPGIDRGISQKSYFILENKNWETKENITDDLLVKIIIKSKVVDDIRELLHRKSISASTIYPDIRGVMIESESQNSHEKRFIDLFYLGLSCLDRKEYNEAIKYYRRAQKIKSENPNIINNIGNALAELGEKEEAIKCYDKAIKINPNYFMAYYNKGTLLSELGKNKKAIKCYDEAIKINPNSATVYINKGTALLKLNQYKDAIMFYDKAIKIDPNSATVYTNKGIVLLKLNKYKDAIKCYDKAIKIDPNGATVYINKGTALLKLNKYKDAIKCYDKAIKINPNDANTYHNKGITLSKLEKHKEAIKCYDKAIKINPNSATVYTNKGIALSKLDKNKEAIKCFDEAIKINPNDVDAYQSIGNMLSKLDKNKEAIKYFDKAIKINPNYLEAYCNKGITLFNLSKYKEAKDCLEQALKIIENQKLDNKMALHIKDLLNKLKSENK